MNIRKNNIEFFFNQFTGRIEDTIFDYSIVDEKGIETERKKESVMKFFEKEIPDTMSIGDHPAAIKIEHFINIILEDIKTAQKIE